MIASAPNDFIEMVKMGMILEEGVREGRLSKDETLTSKKYGESFSEKKEGETKAVSARRQRRPHVRKNSQSRQHHHQVSSVISVFTKNFNQSISSYSATTKSATTITKNQQQQQQ